MLKKNITLFFFLISFVTIAYGQGKQITNEQYKFTLNCPADMSITEIGDTVLEFRGTKKTFDTDAIFFLKNVVTVKIPLDKLEAYMQDAPNIEDMNKNFIESMKIGFPDIVSIDKNFIYFNDRPTMQGTYSFTKNEIPMKGRFMLVLAKEQSSIYVFSWTAKTSMYESWNKASEKSVKSLKLSN